MPFALRNKGVLTGLFSCRQQPNQEWLDDDSPEVIAFLSAPSPPALPDVRKIVQALVRKGVINNQDVE